MEDKPRPQPQCLVEELEGKGQGCMSGISKVSDGVGRTGTFICIHSQLERLKTEGVVDIFQAIKSIHIQKKEFLPSAVSNILHH